jgi:hypothetical protein
VYCNKTQGAGEGMTASGMVVAVGWPGVLVGGCKVARPAGSCHKRQVCVMDVHFAPFHSTVMSVVSQLCSGVPTSVLRCALPHKPVLCCAVQVQGGITCTLRWLAGPGVSRA